jgi:hypothetical protein
MCAQQLAEPKSSKLRSFLRKERRKAMNCTSCGNPLAPDVRFCTRCGAARFVSQPLYPDRVRRHLQSLGVLWLVYAALRAVKGVVGLAFLQRFLGDHAFGFFPVWPFAGVALGFGVLGALFTGYALLTRQPWGRIVAIVFGVLALLHPVMGTVLGIYTLWVLAPSESGASYDRETLNRRTV